MPEDLETRTVMTPRTGTKICILIGLAFIVVAVYFYFVPVTTVRTSSGSVFGCGTAASPAKSVFAQGTCARVTDVEKYRAIAAAVIGVLTIVLGAVMFGVDRRTETRPGRRTDGYADDHPRSGDRRRWDDDPRHRYADERERDERDRGERGRDEPDRGEREPDRGERERDERERDDRERDDRDRGERGADEADRPRTDRPIDDRDRADHVDANARPALADLNPPSRRERPRRSDWDDDRH